MGLLEGDWKVIVLWGLTANLLLGGGIIVGVAWSGLPLPQFLLSHYVSLLTCHEQLFLCYAPLLWHLALETADYGLKYLQTGARIKVASFNLPVSVMMSQYQENT